MKGDGESGWTSPVEFCTMLVFWYCGGGMELVLCILSPFF